MLTLFHREPNGGRVFENQIIFPQTNSPQTCLSQCSDFGYPAAGMEYGDECCERYTALRSLYEITYMDTPLRVRRRYRHHQQWRYGSCCNRLQHGLLRRPHTFMWGPLEAAALHLERQHEYLAYSYQYRWIPGAHIFFHSYSCAYVLKRLFYVVSRSWPCTSVACHCRDKRQGLLPREKRHIRVRKLYWRIRIGLEPRQRFQSCLARNAPPVGRFLFCRRRASRQGCSYPQCWWLVGSIDVRSPTLCPRRFAWRQWHK